MTTNTSSSRPLAMAKQAFSPAIWVLNRLRYAIKFTLIGVILLVPFGYVTYLQYQGTTASVTFNSNERIGARYLAPALDYLHAVQRHRIYAAAAALGVADGRANAEKAASDAAGAEREVDAVDARFGGLLKTRERWIEAKEAWSAARESNGALVDVDRAHKQAGDVIADLILNYVGNNSNLILDPDLDSYWLMDALVVKLPLLGNTIASATVSAIGSTAGDLDAMYGVAALRLSATSNTADLESIDVATAIRETQRFGKSATIAQLSGPVGVFRDAVDSFSSAVQREYLSSTPTRNPVSVVDTAGQALEDLYAFGAATTPELSRLIEQRIGRYQSSRSNALAAAAVAALLLLYVFIGFFLAVQGSLRAISGATDRMISGTNETFALATRDEFAQVAVQYNQINAALVESRTLQKKVQNDNDELQANIMQMLSAVSDASDGDLRVRAPITAGALGNVADAFNQLMESLERLIGDVSLQVQQTSEGIQQINQVAQEMADGATSQVKEIAAATTSAERMADQMQQVSKNTADAASAARNTEESAVAGESAVSNVVSGMDSLRLNVQSGAKKIKSLGDRSMEITGIVGTINRVSEQTNMLALNAAIEAARAGEHGRGFSVVAEEVRKLAERTAAATQEIEKLVKAIHVETNESVDAIEQQTQVVERESEVVGSAGAALRRIREVSSQSAALVDRISALAIEQTGQTREVAKAMAQVSSIATSTQRGAASTVATAGRLLVLSSKLTDVVGRFRVQGRA